MGGVKLRSMTSVYFIRDDAILCLYRIGSRIADRQYIGAAGGHFEYSELDDPSKCVMRELREEMGLTASDIRDLKLRYITHRLKNGEIRQNYFYFAKLGTEAGLHSTEGTLRWVKPEEFAQLPMPVSAKHMILHYLSTGCHDDELYCGITEEAGTEFVRMTEF